MEIGAFLKTTFIDSGAGLSILLGLSTTLRISLFALLFGTLLAVPLCAMRMSPRRIFSVPSRLCVALVRGTPVLMLLMVFYYVVFASSRIDAVYIAILVFSIHTGAVVSDIMVTSLRAIPQGQIDAAHALGMQRWETFRNITLPQAGRIGLSSYRGAVISLIQWTSVVGYISITDLTRAINFISSRTLQPLLMLFVGIVLYLLMSYGTYGIFALVERRKTGISYRYDRRKQHD